MASRKWTESLVPAVRAMGANLTSQGIANIAWPLDSAADVIEHVRSAGWAVLGGDLFEKRADRFKHSYDNWNCGIRAGEAWLDYVNRSCDHALGYLGQSRLGSELWFSAEVVEKPNAAQLAKSYDR
jgi:Immunity protein 40